MNITEETKDVEVEKSSTVKIVLDKFPTHLPITNNKKAANKYVKINNQTIYNGYINRFSRAILINNMHNYIVSKIPKGLEVIRFPILVHLEIHTVINHGDISRFKGIVRNKPAKIGYKPDWDIENLAAIWRKAINDSLVTAKVIPDDTIEYVIGNSEEFIKTNSLETSKIVINLIKK